MKRSFLMAASFAALFAPSAMAQTAETAEPAAPMETMDFANLDAQQFVELAASSNTLEITSSESALESVEDPEIQAFAQRMIDDHTAATTDLVAIAEAEGISYSGATAPVAMHPDHVKMLDQLGTSEGPEFAAQYVDLQVAAHEEAVALFEAYVQNGDNEALKAFAAETLPVLQEHLEMAQTLDSAS